MTQLPDNVARLLPFVLPVALMSYIVVAAFGGAIRRKRKLNAALRRKSDPRPPWDRWLEDINRKEEAEKRPGAIEKWRE